MTQAIAAVASQTLSPAVEATTPVVLVDGVIVADLQALHCTARLTNNVRSAHLAWVSPEPPPPTLARAGTVSVLIPHVLSDGEARWQVLLSGSMVAVEESLSLGTDQRRFVIEDDLAGALDKRAERLGGFNDEWTLRDLLAHFALGLQAEMVYACGCSRLDQPAAAKALQNATVAEVLNPALASSGLRLKQSLSLERDQVRRTLMVLPERAGRTIALPWPDEAGHGGGVLEIDTEIEQQPARLWIALGSRPVVEDTFALVQGWDPSLAGQSDSAYGRLTSTDFSLYGAVYRAWVLNEDGVFSGPPFNQGDAFDVGSLFDSPSAEPAPLRFADCLTRDAAGRPIAPVIESSTDGGANWSAYPGEAEVMSDRAGVLLTDDTLPASILAAAQAGTLRLRVTASLTGAEPIQAQRWDGNPFAGAGPTKRLRLGDPYAWRRVAPGSLHADAIDAGQLTADTADDRAALRTALLENLDRSPGPTTVATIELAGAWTALRAGDLASEVLGPGIAIDGTPAVFSSRRGRVHDLRIDFGVFGDAPRTRLTFD